MRKRHVLAIATSVLLIGLPGCQTDQPAPPSAVPATPTSAPIAAAPKHHPIAVDTTSTNGMKDSVVAGTIIDWQLPGGDTSPFVICFQRKDPCKSTGPIHGSHGAASCTIQDAPIAGTYKYDVGTDSCPVHPVTVTPCRGCGELDITDSE
jgi:hypothetical protein